MANVTPALPTKLNQRGRRLAPILFVALLEDDITISFYFDILRMHTAYGVNILRTPRGGWFLMHFKIKFAYISLKIDPQAAKLNVKSYYFFTSCRRATK